MEEIEAVLKEATSLQAEYERIALIPFPAVRRRSRQHFRLRLKRFLMSVEEASNGLAATYQQLS